MTHTHSLCQIRVSDDFGSRSSVNQKPFQTKTATSIVERVRKRLLHTPIVEMSLVEKCCPFVGGFYSPTTQPIAVVDVYFQPTVNSHTSNNRLFHRQGRSTREKTPHPLLLRARTPDNQMRRRPPRVLRIPCYRRRRPHLSMCACPTSMEQRIPARGSS